MSIELESLDTYIDSLRTELEETTVSHKIKSKFTLDIISKFEKSKCIKYYNLNDKCLEFFCPRDYVDYIDPFIEPFIIQIKFKNEIIDLKKLFNIYVNSDFNISLRYLVISSILNNTCIIDGSNLYFINNNYFPICEYISNIYESIIDDIWIYKTYKDVSKIIKFTLKYYIKQLNFSYQSYQFDQNIGLIINFDQIDETQLIPSISYIIFEYEFEINDVEFKKNTRFDILSKDKVNINGNYYWIKNIFQFDELITKPRSFYNCSIYLYSDLDECICDSYIINYYFVYKIY